ncbi:DUF1254 domain-containing protein [Urbifossiella limnaea]|uniref:DUF1254 domain-containing protein n=1 Tax=Urbifossiella limnaea TaxID=2528023 RepID=A0A517XQ75_9BACT|nr:DUF1254 domain-containing protein [Urbifossiella limnaea]QDU19665.1 hypothetical protein ETAA1_15950 [Urbifossiella limnaea]
MVPRFAFVTLCAGGLLAVGAAHAPVDAQTAPPAEAEAAQLATDAYVYGYPLLTMEYTRRVMTNTAEPKGTHAPMGQFVRMRAYPDAKFRDVTAPNADTLYSTAWLDLGKEPYVLSLPDMGDRYFLMPMLDGWTNVFEVPGTRTTGNKAQAYAITGPGWKGTIPAGLKELKAPTNLVWVLGRTYCTGTAEDYKACHAVMDRYDLRPLSAYGKAYTPPPGTVDPAVDTKTAVREQVNKLDGAAYFGLLARLMKDNPPAAADGPMVAKLARLGVAPGQAFDAAKLAPAVAAAVAQAPKAGVERITRHFKDAGTLENGWTFTTKAGVYGTAYLQRAFITAIGLGANRPQDAVYPTSEVDADGKKYTGANRYVLHFGKGEAPPVNAFWSVTMYDAHYFFVNNPLNRYTVSPRNDLKYNPDGSLDLYIQHESPGAGKESNWLPAPRGEFVLMMRLYYPKATAPSILDGTWKVPPVRVVR